MATSNLVQGLIDNVLGRQQSEPLIPAELLIKSAQINLESDIDLSKFKRILIIGMGGGCDVFSAYAYYKHLSAHFQSIKESGTAPTLLFGNCLGIRDDLKKHKKVCNYLYEIHQHSEFKEDEKNEHYGTTRLEESIPFEYNKETNTFHGPYLFAVPIKEFSAQINNIQLATLINNEVLSESYRYLNVDLIIGIDNGGDSLTCGIDYKHHPQLARDRQVLYSMKHNKEKVPYIHIVFGPGCDGESTVEQLQDTLNDTENKFLGRFEVNKEMTEVMRERTKLLSEIRTPNIMYNAFVAKSQDKEKHHEKEVTVEIPRGRKPRIHIPRSWLYSCWVFSTKIQTKKKLNL